MLDCYDAYIFYHLWLQRTYAERIRGEARKKWLQYIITAADTGGASIEPVYKAVFQALYKVRLQFIACSYFISLLTYPCLNIVIKLSLSEYCHDLGTTLYHIAMSELV
jgi:hypothetical protein